jgi:hypothetical protein
MFWLSSAKTKSKMRKKTKTRENSMFEWTKPRFNPFEKSLNASLEIL